jgi:hypothetical protein
MFDRDPQAGLVAGKPTPPGIGQGQFPIFRKALA